VFQILIRKPEGTMLDGSLVTMTWHVLQLHVDGGEGLQIWKVSANVLNKQLQTADKVWSSSLGVGCGANNLSL
jgi:hypothetical protein